MAAAFGWEKLHYGFSFLDEGYHMTESWRLAAGDHFLKDKFTGAHMLYTLINCLIFKICPDITLLGFRKLQYFLTIFSLLLLSLALFKVDKQYWYQPFIFSLFAFTGLDSNGLGSNLNYYTYPHLFLTVYLSFFILGLYQKDTIIKRLLYVASGLFLWGISLSLLQLSVIIFSPILLFLVSHRLRLKSFSFKFADLCYVLAPFMFCWMVFIGIYNKPYILSVIKSISFYLSIPGYTAGSLMGINWEALKHVGVSMLFLFICMLGLKKIKLFNFIIYLTFISILMFFIIDTSLFGLITPYWRGWFSRPMWFSSLLISFFIMFLFHIVKKHYTGRQYNRGEELSIVLLIPCTILALSTGFFSRGGALAISESSIPAIAAITSVILHHKRIHMKSYSIKLLILIILEEYNVFKTKKNTIAWSDWKSTCFDVFPEHANATIQKAFGKGIKTNRIYHNLYEWIRMNTERYTVKDDFMISYVVSPMVHMISKRRPSLDDSFIAFFKPVDYYQESIELMKERGRYPKIAFVFESMPAFYPVSLKENKFTWFGKQFTFPSKDPISRYVIENMRLLEEYKICEGNTVRCFVASNMINKKALEDQEERRSIRVLPKSKKGIYRPRGPR